MLPWEAVELVEWMYSTPRAAVRAMLDLVSQSSGVRPELLLPVQQKYFKDRDSLINYLHDDGQLPQLT
jgi:hypothetical protein